MSRSSNNHKPRLHLIFLSGPASPSYSFGVSRVSSLFFLSLLRFPRAAASSLCLPVVGRNRQTNRQTDRQRQTDKQTETVSQRQTDRKTDTERQTDGKRQRQRRRDKHKQTPKRTLRESSPRRGQKDIIRAHALSIRPWHVLQSRAN